MKTIDYTLGIFFALLCIITWGVQGSTLFNWAWDLSVYSIQRAALPLYFMFKYREEKGFVFLSAVALLGISSSISDVYCIDTYDGVILFLKVALTFGGIIYLIKGMFK